MVGNHVNVVKFPDSVSNALFDLQKKTCQTHKFAPLTNSKWSWQADLWGDRESKIGETILAY